MTNGEDLRSLMRFVPHNVGVLAVDHEGDRMGVTISSLIVSGGSGTPATSCKKCDHSIELIPITARCTSASQRPPRSRT